MNILLSRLWLFFFIPIYFSNCDKDGLCEDDKLSITRDNYSGGQLRIDGYYFRNFSKEESFSDVYYLYNNGVFIGGGGISVEDLKDPGYIPPINTELVKGSKAGWGVFQINGSTIEIERWRPRPNGCETTIYERGAIINDSTYSITLREHRSKGKVNSSEELDIFFHFRPLSEKPDSTNSFIE